MLLTGRSFTLSPRRRSRCWRSATARVARSSPDRLGPRPVGRAGRTRPSRRGPGACSLRTRRRRRTMDLVGPDDRPRAGQAGGSDGQGRGRLGYSSSRSACVPVRTNPRSSLAARGEPSAARRTGRGRVDHANSGLIRATPRWAWKTVPPAQLFSQTPSGILTLAPADRSAERWPCE
jgi:hypothetical protein